MKRLIRKYPLWSFVIINYAISWTFLYPCYQIIKQNEEITPLALIGLIGAYGPSIAAVIVQSVLDRKGVSILLKKLIKFKVGLNLYLLIILAPILLYSLAYLMSAVVFQGDFSIHWRVGFSNIAFWILVALPFGPMGEELGWRGFLLPKLLEQYSILKSTVLVGIAWGVWHLASFSFPGAAIPDFLPVNVWTIGLFILNTIALSFLYTYVHLKSRGSVFLAILLHAFFNAASNVVFDFFTETDEVDILLTSYCLNIGLAAIFGYLLIKKTYELKKIVS